MTQVAPQTTNSTNNLNEFFAHVRTQGKLRSDTHAHVWTRGTLNILGVNISKDAKQALQNELPQALANWLGGIFWPLHFRNENIAAIDFQNRVARRSGNTDAVFAKYPVTAVFGALKRIISQNTAQKVADSLAPDILDLWQNS